MCTKSIVLFLLQNFNVFDGTHLKIIVGFPNDPKNRNLISTNGINFRFFYLSPKLEYKKSVDSDGNETKVPVLILGFFVGPSMFDFLSDFLEQDVLDS